MNDSRMPGAGPSDHDANEPQPAGPPVPSFDAGVLALDEFLGLRAGDHHPDGMWIGEMDVSSDTLNISGSVHGGAVATMIDWAAGWGSLHLTGRMGPTTDVFIRYLAAAREGTTLRAVTTVDRVGRSSMAVAVRVTDDSGRLIAIGSVGFAIARG